MKLDKENQITEEQALHIANFMHRFWDVLAVEVTDERVYMSTNKLGVIVITDNGIYPLKDNMNKYFSNYQNGA